MAFAKNFDGTDSAASKSNLLPSIVTTGTGRANPLPNGKIAFDKINGVPVFSNGNAWVAIGSGSGGGGGSNIVTWRPNGTEDKANNIYKTWTDVEAALKKLPASFRILVLDPEGSLVTGPIVVTIPTGDHSDAMNNTEIRVNRNSRGMQTVTFEIHLDPGSILGNLAGLNGSMSFSFNGDTTNVIPVVLPATIRERCFYAINGAIVNNTGGDTATYFCQIELTQDNPEANIYIDDGGSIQNNAFVLAGPKIDFASCNIYAGIFSNIYSSFGNNSKVVSNLVPTNFGSNLTIFTANPYNVINSGATWRQPLTGFFNGFTGVSMNRTIHTNVIYGASFFPPFVTEPFPNISDTNTVGWDTGDEFIPIDMSKNFPPPPTNVGGPPYLYYLTTPFAPFWFKIASTGYPFTPPPPILPVQTSDTEESSSTE